MVSPAPEASRVIKEKEVNLESKAKRVNGVQKVSRVTWVRKEIGVDLDLQEHRVLKGLRVPKEGERHVIKNQVSSLF